MKRPEAPSPSNASMRILVALIAAWSLIFASGALSVLFNPPMVTGLVLDDELRVSQVPPGSAAAAAGIMLGDKLTPPIPLSVWTRSDPATFDIVRNGTMRVVTLVPKPAPLTITRKITFVMRAIVALLFLTLGSVLVLTRPSRMTWCFYLWCANARFFNLRGYWPGSPAMHFAGVTSSGFLAAVSIPLILVFAARFPENDTHGWRTTVERAAYGFVGVFVVLQAYGNVALFFGLPSTWSAGAWSVCAAIVYLAASIVLISTYRSSSGEQRQRLRWVLVFPVVLILRIVEIGLWQSATFDYPVWIDDAIILIGACVPAAVTYAIIRYRVFDLNFFISRTVVYGALSSMIVGFFSLIHWFVGRQLAETRLAFLTEVGAALAVGFWLNGLHRRAEYLVDAVFFRRRHLAERQLAGTAAALPHAGSVAAINDLVVREPVRALGLASAAVFRLAGDANFLREAAIGWNDAHARRIDREDPLVVHLTAELAALRVHDLGWTRDDIPSGAAEPTLALPILVRRRLSGIVLYGAHENAADIDPDEEQGLVPIAVAAAAAYDHLEAEALHAEVAALKIELASRLYKKRPTQRSDSKGASG